MGCDLGEIAGSAGDAAWDHSRLRESPDHATTNAARLSTSGRRPCAILVRVDGLTLAGISHLAPGQTATGADCVRSAGGIRRRRSSPFGRFMQCLLLRTQRCADAVPCCEKATPTQTNNEAGGITMTVSDIEAGDQEQPDHHEPIQITIDRREYEVLSSPVTGREVRAAAKPPIAEDRTTSASSSTGPLRRRSRRRQMPVGRNGALLHRTPAHQPRAMSNLPPHDLLFLDGLGLRWSETVESAHVCVVIKEWRLPPATHPTVAIFSFGFPRAIRRRNRHVWCEPGSPRSGDAIDTGGR